MDLRDNTQNIYLTEKVRGIIKEKGLSFIVFEFDSNEASRATIEVEVMKKGYKYNDHLGEIKYKPGDTNGSFVEDETFKKVKPELDLGTLKALTFALQHRDYIGFPNMQVYSTEKKQWKGKNSF